MAFAAASASPPVMRVLCETWLLSEKPPPTRRRQLHVIRFKLLLQGPDGCVARLDQLEERSVCWHAFANRRKHPSLSARNWWRRLVSAIMWLLELHNFCRGPSCLMAWSEVLQLQRFSRRQRGMCCMHACIACWRGESPSWSAGAACHV